MVAVVERDGPDWISTPGESLLVHLRRRRIAPAALAAALDGGMARLRALLDGSGSIDQSAAETLASVLGGGAGLWLRRQENFDRALDRAIDGMSAEERDGWLARVPGPGRSGPGRHGAARRSEELRRRMAFYGAATLGEWERRYAGVREATTFRTSEAFSSREGAVSLWLRSGELSASLIETGIFDPGSLVSVLPEVRRFTGVRQLDRCLPALRDLLAPRGVALVIAPAPAGCRASGATRLVEPGKAMLLLSLRHRSDDHLWFTVFHELGHLVLHSGQTFVDGEDTPIDDREVEADRFAAEAIVPPIRDRELLALGRTPRHRDVTRYAVSIGVAPGLVVGQLQHRGLIGPDRLNFLKRRFDRAEVEAVAST